MINILLSGCNGKMGKIISSLASEDSEIKIAAGYDINTVSEFGYKVYDNPDNISEEIDVIIDFSHPAAFNSVMEYALRKEIPVIVCTTGLSKEQIDCVNESSKKIPVFYSANMSIGINLIIQLAKTATKLLADKFDIEIIEKHHNQKIDAPSGTALAIADEINAELDNTMNFVYDRHSVRKKREKKEIGIHAVRGGTIVGEHDVLFAGNDEIITISHSARSKEVFAVGAIKAAKYMYGKPAGMYNMNKMIEEL